MPISSVLWFPARDFKLGRVGGREGGGISKVRICPFDLTPPLGFCIEWLKIEALDSDQSTVSATCKLQKLNKYLTLLASVSS